MIKWRHDLDFPLEIITCLSRHTFLQNLHSHLSSGIIIQYHLTWNADLRRSRIKMQFSYLHFKHPNILRTSYELFHLGCLGGDRPHKKFGRESSSEVRKMLGCLKCKYQNCIFIRERLHARVFFITISKLCRVFAMLQVNKIPQNYQSRLFACFCHQSVH